MIFAAMRRMRRRKDRGVFWLTQTDTVNVSRAREHLVVAVCYALWLFLGFIERSIEREACERRARIELSAIRTCMSHLSSEGGAHMRDDGCESVRCWIS